LYGTPDEAFFVSQIVRRIDVGVGTLQRELATLADAGLILREQTGNQAFCRANRDHPAYAELHDLLAKITGVFHQLAEALTP
jgi:DNA-binding transcriptional ArsR family regulator